MGGLPPKGVIQQNESLGMTVIILSASSLFASDNTYLSSCSLVGRFCVPLSLDLQLHCRGSFR